MDTTRPYDEISLANKIKKNWLGITIGLIAIAIAAGLVLWISTQTARRQSQYKYEGVVSATDPTFGKKDSNLQVVIVEDYFCPHCKNNNPIFERAVAEYGDRVKFVYKPIQALTGSREIIPYALAADKQGKFLEITRKIYENNDKVYSLRKEAVKDIAKTISGLDYDRWLNDATNDQGIKDKVLDIDDDLKNTEMPKVDGQEGKQKGTGFPGTPGVLVLKDGVITNWWSGEINMSGGEDAGFKEMQSRLEKGFGTGTLPAVQGTTESSQSSAMTSTAASK